MDHCTRRTQAADFNLDICFALPMREYRDGTDDPSKVPEVIRASGEYKKSRRIAIEMMIHTHRDFFNATTHRIPVGVPDCERAKCLTSKQV